MSRYLLGLLMGLAVAGCAGKNTVAGADKTKAEQLESSLPSWCRTTCERFNDCATAGCDCQGDVCDCSTPDTDCPAECEREMGRFTTGDDACADRGEKFKRCIDALSCNDLNGNGAKSCSLTDAEESACPGPDQTTDPPASVGGGPVEVPPSGTGAGGNTGSGGAIGGSGGASGGTGTGGATGGAAAAPSTGGSTSTGELVKCSSAYGAGGAAGDVPASLSTTCEEGRGECSDKHEYSWLCARGSEGQIGCACFVDMQVTGAFDPGSSSCPSLEVVNAGCSWNLGY